MIKSGVQLIAEERIEQIVKHGHSLSSDAEKYQDHELIRAACAIAFVGDKDKVMTCTMPAPDWAWAIRGRIENDRIHCLKVAGALLAAEIDRLQNI